MRKIMKKLFRLIGLDQEAEETCVFDAAGRRVAEDGFLEIELGGDLVWGR